MTKICILILKVIGTARTNWSGHSIRITLRVYVLI